MFLKTLFMFSCGKAVSVASKDFFCFVTEFEDVDRQFDDSDDEFEIL